MQALSEMLPAASIFGSQVDRIDHIPSEVLTDVTNAGDSLPHNKSSPNDFKIEENSQKTEDHQFAQDIAQDVALGNATTHDTNRRRPSGEEHAYNRRPSGEEHGYNRRPSAEDHAYNRRPSGEEHAYNRRPSGEDHAYNRRPSGEDAYNRRPSGEDHTYNRRPSGEDHAYNRRPSGDEHAVIGSSRYLQAASGATSDAFNPAGSVDAPSGTGSSKALLGNFDMQPLLQSLTDHGFSDLDMASDAALQDLSDEASSFPANPLTSPTLPELSTKVPPRVSKHDSFTNAENLQLAQRVSDMLNSVLD